MTVEECIDKVIAACASVMILPSPNPREVNTSRDDIRVALHALILTESKRAAAIFKRYLQASRDAWGPGASNPLKASDYINEILRTSPGKGGG